jgi:predicted Holliday junction resolvase-like endonuclease
MNELIEIISSSKEILIKCTNCSETFSPRQASLFDIREKYPEKIRRYLENSINKAVKENGEISNKIKATIQKINGTKLEQNIIKQKIRQKPKRIKTITQQVNIGQILEKILPASKKFDFDPADCRSIFDPIDYVSFNGLSKKTNIESITLIEIKTGGATLQKNQKDIKEKIAANKTKFVEY